MKHFFIASLLLLSSGASAQTQISKYRPGITPEGAIYFLPKTALRIVVQIEKTTYTPGDLAKYSERYLRLKDVEIEPSVSYRVTSIGLTSIGIPDTAKCYAVLFNAKTSASNIVLSEDGILQAINTDIKQPALPAAFTPAKKPERLNPRQFMNEETLAAGSTAKMAELTARDIYDIRESRNLLNRGQADTMPKDGEQLRLMLRNLDTQESALMQLFTGTTVKDTTEQVIIYCPQGEVKQELLFRLSRRLGMVDKDDLAGQPYYITVDDLHSLPKAAPAVDDKADKRKKKEHENGIYVNVPGKIKVSITKGTALMGSFELYAAQYGYTELLSGDLFNKRYTTRLSLHPVTGSVEKLEAEQPK